MNYQKWINLQSAAFGSYYKDSGVKFASLADPQCHSLSSHKKPLQKFIFKNLSNRKRGKSCFDFTVMYYSTISVSSDAVYQNLRAWAVLAWAVGPCSTARAERQLQKKIRYLCCRINWKSLINSHFRLPAPMRGRGRLARFAL